jgi:hypothetical protein
MTGGGPDGAGAGHDEACAADLAAVAEGRALARADAAWLARAVTGAIRPSRDRPVWDLAHAGAALGGDPRRLIDLALDPRLASPAALRARVEAEGGASTDPLGLALAAPRPWRCSWAGLARLLALLEFLLTADECARFGEVSALLAALDGPEDAPDVARRLAAGMGEYRRAHMPLAAVERRFGAIRAFLRRRGQREFGDAEVLDFWREGAGEEVLFATVVEHFITYARVAAELEGLGALGGAVRLGDIENWEERLEAASLPTLDGPALDGALRLLAERAEDGPKLLTGAEREALGAILHLDPFHRTRPLTALRARAFGRVQSGIANRLRRGSGGPEVAERVRCAEADYAALAEQADALAAHLRRCLTIALALRAKTGDGSDLVEAGERELRRMRRAGFDAGRPALAAAVAAVDGALATVTFELDAHREALARLAATEALEARLRRDRGVFSEAFATLYLGAGLAAPLGGGAP